MPNVLLSWIGETDLKASKGEISGLGPVAQALTKRSFDEAVLLSNYGDRKTEIAAFKSWLATKTETALTVRHEKLHTPTDYADIARAASRAVSELVANAESKKRTLTFHLSPGTPAMAAVWILLAPQFGAKLIQSSRERGVEEANVPFEITAEFIPSMVRAVDSNLERLTDGLRPEEPDFADIAYRSQTMKQLVARAKMAAPYSAAILIEGESGTGKELLAAAIHKASGRRGSFVAVNCGALPKELVESAFFGHKKGAFTGATADQPGYFERADGGTLFLDEVGELPLDAQVKLLRATQEKKVQRVGEAKDRAIDVRLVAATNRDLLSEVAAGRFREDLYFRLGTLILKTPALRDRDGDVGFLAERFLDKINEDEGARLGGGRKKLSATAKNLLLRHAWPGNIRELQATLLRAFVWSRAERLEEADIRDALVSSRSARPGDVLNRALGEGFDLEATLTEVVRHYIERALSDAQGNKTKAAKLVGLASPQTLTNWMKRHGVEG